MKIFVTGGSGFIGGHAVRKFLSEGHDVVAPARRQDACDRIRALGATSETLDYSDSGALRTAMTSCEAVVHIAAHLKMWGPWAEFHASNVTLTEQMLDAARICEVRDFVHVSAASVIMESPGPIYDAEESSRLTSDPRLPYSATKATAESGVLAARTDNFRTVVLRPPFVWGRGDAVDGDLGKQINRGLFAWIAQGRYPYATCHVRNLCHAISLAIGSEVDGAFFITDGDEIALRDFMIARLHANRLKPPGISVPAPVAWLFGGVLEKSWATGWLPGSPPLTREMVRLIGYPFTLNISRARSLLGYTPEISIAAGMSELSG